MNRRNFLSLVSKLLIALPFINFRQQDNDDIKIAKLSRLGRSSTWQLEGDSNEVDRIARVITSIERQTHSVLINIDDMEYSIPVYELTKHK